MNIVDNVDPLKTHPVAALSPQDRQIAHCEAIGGILAAIALRKADQTTTGAQPLRSLQGSLQRKNQEVATVS